MFPSLSGISHHSPSGESSGACSPITAADGQQCEMPSAYEPCTDDCWIIEGLVNQMDAFVMMDVDVDRWMGGRAEGWVDG